jgi:hypothetical protein
MPNKKPFIVNLLSIENFKVADKIIIEERSLSGGPMFSIALYKGGMKTYVWGFRTEGYDSMMSSNDPSYLIDFCKGIRPDIDVQISYNK